MSTIKLQLVCFLITLFVFVRYTRLSKIFATSPSSTAFIRLLRVALIETVLDVATAYTVNTPSVSPWINGTLHWLFFIAIDTLMYCSYLYFLASLPEGNTHPRDRRMVNILYVVNMIIVTLTMPFVYYVEGDSTNYSMGLPVYACFLMASFYVILLGYKLISRWKAVTGAQKSNAITIVMVLAIVATIQFLFPESLVTGFVSAFTSVSAYINHEDPIRCQFKVDKDKIKEEFDLIDRLNIKRAQIKIMEKAKLQEPKGDVPILELMSSTQDSLRIEYSNFIMAESLGNYVNVYHLIDGKVTPTQLRQTMKVFEQNIEKYPRLVRVHRAYVVNLDKVNRIEGNSQGYQLYFDGIEEVIPVSRTYISNFNNALA